MTCPNCGSNTIVKDSRKVKNLVARRRVCKKCSYSFYTEEVEVDNNDALKYFWSFASRKILTKSITKSITKTG